MLWNQLVRKEGKLAESLHLNQLLDDDMFSLFVCSVYIIGCSMYILSVCFCI